MSLTWNIANVKDYENTCYIEDPSEGRRVHPATESLVWYTVACCMTGITADNADELWARIYLYDRVCGPIYTIKGEQAMTRDIVLAHVGLTTNVSTVERQEWLRNLWDNAVRDSKAKLTPRPIDELRSHTQRSLEPMVDVLEVLCSRGTITDDDIEAMSEDAVDDLYWRHLAPVIEKIQSRVVAARHRED